jgi:hypothetical protein
MDKSWWPTIAGMLDIISGSLGIIFGLLVVVGIVVCSAIGTGRGVPEEFLRFGPEFLIAIVIPLVILNIVSLIGGIYALKKKRWAMALAGSITTFLVNWFFGVAAIVFTVLSRDEFEG